MKVQSANGSSIMTSMGDIPLRKLQFYVTSTYPCSYLPDRQARSQVATPSYLIDGAVYSALVKFGFRRSGLYTYRPHCDRCRACVPVRLVVDEFIPNRSQRRAFNKHSNLEACSRPLKYDEEHFALYRRYQSQRHTGGGMDQDNQEQFTHFLLQSNVSTRLIEFREGDNLRMVSVVDELDDGLSSVYTFYDPDTPGASYGTYNVLWQAALCKSLGLPYLYLGYWIKESRKMAYKANYQPLEGLIDGTWQTFDANP
jgi:arginyl-tRNA--protein-N-Asp/Glu arginylyltransferase